MAVAFDSQNSTSHNSNTTSDSFSLTFVGTPTIGVITGILVDSSSTIGGGAVTTGYDGGLNCAMFYRLNPANGNYVANHVSFPTAVGGSAFTGSATSGTIIGVTGAASAAHTLTLTSTNASGILVDSCIFDNDNSAATATGTGQTKMWMKNAAFGGSSNTGGSSYTTDIAASQTISYSAGSGGGINAMEILPPVAAGPTNVKTKDGITQSTGIKTYEGLALASVKSVEGVT